MNYTFLPYSEQHDLRREYRVRALIVLSFFISIAIVVGTASLFPAYIYAGVEQRLHLDQVAAAKKSKDAVTLVATEKGLQADGALLSTISDTFDADVFYSAISSIVMLKGKIAITSFSLDQPAPGAMSIIISGVAPTRNDLLGFKSRLENMSPSAQVDLPVSILAQDTNVAFSIKVDEKI